MSIELITNWDRSWAENHPQRIRAVQKDAFLQELTGELDMLGYTTRQIETGSLIKNRVLITQCEQPEVILLAHYDTPTQMPFWIEWLYRIFGHTRQIPMIIALIFLLQLPNWLGDFLSSRYPQFSSIDTSCVGAFYILLIFSFIPFLIPNPHNREDNTSGVIGLMALADRLKDRTKLKDRVQFAFLDNEELGLLGSGALKSWWDQQGNSYQHAVIISLDCIARGRVPLIVHHGQNQLAGRLLPHLQTYLPDARTIDMGIIPLSDNYTFRQQGAIDITCADPAIIPGGYVVPRIHIRQDNDLNPERLAACVDGVLDFIQSEIFGQT